MFSKVVTGFVAMIFAGGIAYAVEKDPLKPRVPADQMAAAKAMKNPVANTPENVAKGKAVFEGKGGCVACHGPAGDGKGIAAAALDPSPRNFHNAAFWKARTDGEIKWVVTNGVVGTGMIGQKGLLTDEEMWQAIVYAKSFSGK